MDEIIRRARWGLDGLLDFATYFAAERGVSGGLFEGKLTNNVMPLKNQIQLDIIEQITHEYMQGAGKP